MELFLFKTNIKQYNNKKIPWSINILQFKYGIIIFTYSRENFFALQ